MGREGTYYTIVPRHLPLKNVCKHARQRAATKASVVLTESLDRHALRSRRAPTRDRLRPHRPRVRRIRDRDRRACAACAALVARLGGSMAMATVPPRRR